MKASQKETELNHLRAEIDALKAQLATLDYEKDEVNNSKGNGKSITKAAKTKKLKQLADTHSQLIWPRYYVHRDGARGHVSAAFSV